MDEIEKLRRKKQEIIEGSGPAQKKRLFYDKGMLPPRGRIDKLLDPGSFVELDMLATHHYRDFGMDQRNIAAEGVISGHGLINGRKVCVYAQDFSALGRAALGPARAGGPRQGPAPRLRPSHGWSDRRWL